MKSTQRPRWNTCGFKLLIVGLICVAALAWYVYSTHREIETLVRADMARKYPEYRIKTMGPGEGWSNGVNYHIDCEIATTQSEMILFLENHGDWKVTWEDGERVK